MAEARIVDTPEGRAAEGEGWFVLNLAEARGERSEGAGMWCDFEAGDAPFPDFGINVHVVQPGQASARYHSETAQEGFLVLHGGCLLIVEEEERRLRAWDFFHCPAGTRHVFVGAGDGPCAILMVGARGPDVAAHYPVSEVAGRHGASSAVDTNASAEAYAGLPREFTPERMTWPPR